MLNKNKQTKQTNKTVLAVHITYNLLGGVFLVLTSACTQPAWSFLHWIVLQ